VNAKPAFELRTEAENGTVAITATGELDIAVAPELESALAAEDASAVLVDLTEVTFLDSAGLRVLLLASERLRRAETPLALAVAPESPVRRMLSLTEAEEALPVFDDRDGAAASLRESGK
jgi:anti-anti-sigma factor